MWIIKVSSHFSMHLHGFCLNYNQRSCTTIQHFFVIRFFLVQFFCNTSTFTADSHFNAITFSKFHCIIYLCMQNINPHTLYTGLNWIELELQIDFDAFASLIGIYACPSFASFAVRSRASTVVWSRWRTNRAAARQCSMRLRRAQSSGKRNPTDSGICADWPRQRTILICAMRRPMWPALPAGCSS